MKFLQLLNKEPINHTSSWRNRMIYGGSTTIAFCYYALPFLIIPQIGLK